MGHIRLSVKNRTHLRGVMGVMPLVPIYVHNPDGTPEGRMALRQLERTQPGARITPLEPRDKGTFATLATAMAYRDEPWAWLVPACTLVFENLSNLEPLTDQGDMALCLSRPGGICLLSREVVDELAALEGRKPLTSAIGDTEPLWQQYLETTPRPLVDLSEAINGGAFDEGLTYADTAWELDDSGHKLIRWHGRTPYLRHGHTRVVSRASSLDFTHAPGLMHRYYMGKGLWGMRIARELRLRFNL